MYELSGIGTLYRGIREGLITTVKWALKRTGYKVVAKEATNVLKPLGLGSTGRTTAENLSEQLAMKEITSNPLSGEMKPLSDPRWPGWRKMQYEHIAPDGNRIIIHYTGRFENGLLKAVDDFKFN